VNGQTYGFQVGSYNRRYPLIIDPFLTYSTFLGGSNSDYGEDIAVDNSGNTYVVGRTRSNDFPTYNPYQAVFGGGTHDVFVAKIDPTGQNLVYLTYLGGSGDDAGYGVAVNNSGWAYITGYTESSDFPTEMAFDDTHNGDRDAFVTSLSPDGSALFFSTFLGGVLYDIGQSIQVDGSGNVYIAGSTRGDFPLQNPIDDTVGESWAAFALKIDALGSFPIYSTYISGTDPAYGYAIDVDVNGNAYVAGYLEYNGNDDFPTVNPIQASYAGGDHDGFITKINAAGDAFVYSTLLGGEDNDWLADIAVDVGGNAYVTGFTNSFSFPTSNAFQVGLAGEFDAFITKINAAGDALVYSTYYGGPGLEMCNDIAVDVSGNAYLTGVTHSDTFFPRVNSIKS